eukprot:TRINITY_DN8436_c0_g1_i1.p1 TRINITY_DN8436_c0_g1~~TRINITY_DN8436_c0_g1_i1.p1  ORF type:complete len:454 (+),score=77.69 TRINITY_DN8436_c0_g1_i1:30-1391(+)
MGNKGSIDKKTNGNLSISCISSDKEEISSHLSEYLSHHQISKAILYEDEGEEILSEEIINFKYSSFPRIYSTLNHSLLFSINTDKWFLYDLYRKDIRELNDVLYVAQFNSTSTECHVMKDKMSISFGGKTMTLDCEIETIQAGGDQCWVMTKDQKVYLFGNQRSSTNIMKGNLLNRDTLDGIKGLNKNSRIVSIGCGFFFSMFLFENGTVLGVGQSNSEKTRGAYLDWRIIDVPKMKTMSCGSNHTVGVSYSNELYFWGTCSWTNGDGKLVKKKIGMGDLVWYNASAGGFYSVASSSEGVFFFQTSLNRPKMITRTQNIILDPLPNNQHIYFLKDWKPNQIKRIHTTYSSAFIVPFNGDIVIVSIADYQDYSAISLLEEFCGTQKIFFPLSANGKPRLVWSKENHLHWSVYFRHIVLFIFLYFKRMNLLKKYSSPFPKVLIIEIIKLISKNYY